MKVSNDISGNNLVYKKQPVFSKQAAPIHTVNTVKTVSKNADTAISGIAKAKIAMDSVPEGYESSHRLILALKNNPEYTNIKKILDEYAFNYIEGQKFLNFDEGINLFDFLKNRNPERMFSNSKVINQVFQSHRINDLAPLFEKISKNSIHQLFLPFYEIENYGLLNVYNLAEIIDYINKKPELLPDRIDLDELSYYMDEAEKDGRIIDFHPEKIIPKLDKLSDFAKHSGENVFGLVAKDLYNKMFLSDGEYIEKLNPERFEVLKELVTDEETKILAQKLLYENPEFLTERTPKLSILSRNVEVVKKYAKLLSKNELDIYPLFSFQGDLGKLLKKIDSLTESILYDGTNMQYAINPENSRVLINDCNKYIDVYDAAMNPLFYEYRTGTNYIDRHVYNIRVEDKIHNTNFSVSEYQISDNSSSILSEIIKKGKHDTEILKESSHPGIYNYYKILPDNTKIPFIETISDENSISYEKNLESLDGTKTFVKYRKNDTFEKFNYEIKDKNGNLLAEKKATVKDLGNGNFEHIIDGNRYFVSHSDDAIVITNEKHGTQKRIVFNELIKNKTEEFKKVLRTFFADELEFISDKIRSVDSVKKLFDSRIISDIKPSDIKTSDIICAPEKPVMLHEIGHEKYRELSENKEFLEIYERERRLFKDNMPPIIQEMTAYFLEKTNNIKLKLVSTPFNEVAAEANVILNSPFFLNETCSRTHFLQQYFPKTIAFLIRHHL